MEFLHQIQRKARPEAVRVELDLSGEAGVLHLLDVAQDLLPVLPGSATPAVERLHLHVLEGVEIIQSLGKHEHGVMNQSIGREQVVLLPHSGVWILFKVLLDRDRLRVDQSEAGDIDVVVNVSVQVDLVDIQTGH